MIFSWTPSLSLYIYIYYIYIVYIYISIYLHVNINIYIYTNQGGELVTAFSPPPRNHLPPHCLENCSTPEPHNFGWERSRVSSIFFSPNTKQKQNFWSPPKKKQMEVWFRGLVDFNDFPLKFPIKRGGALVVLGVFVLKHCFVKVFFRPQSTVFGCPVFVKQTINVSIFDTSCKAK